MPASKRRDEVAVDEADARLGVRRGDDDEHLVGVGDDDALDLVGVVGAAPQQRRALADAARCGRGCPGSPVVSPTRSTRSPVTTDLRRSSLARAAVITRSSGPSSSIEHGCSGRGRRRARMPATASACSGRVLVRGRLPRRLGRTRTSDSSNSVLVLVVVGAPTRSCQHLLPERGELGQGLAGRRDVVDDDAGHREADDRARSWPCGGRRRRATARRGAAPGSMRRPSSSSVTRAAEPVDLGGERREAVGLVVADVADAGDRARLVGEGRERDEVRHEFAGLREVEVDAADAAAAVRAGSGACTVSRSPSTLDAGAELAAGAARAARRPGWSRRASR